MDISSNTNNSDINRSNHFLSISQIVLGIARQLICFFTLTEDEQLKAGIDVGNKEADR